MQQLLSSRIAWALLFCRLLSRGFSADSTCGHECTSDSDCGGCGSAPAGKCSSPAKDTKYPTIAATCVDMPAGAPTEPKANPADSAWPKKWTANVRSWTYGDFSSKTAVAKGFFYYDADGGHSRADWHPYINGKDAKQVWIGGTGSAKSKYYVKSGFLCIYFPISDPGAGGASVSVEYPDWISKCDAAGMAKYMGREQVEGEWTDHYACVVDYAQVNQTIVFQNWHSLGLGKTAKGMPMRVTGGNSAPSPTKGSPRLNTVWYTNFTVGDKAVKDSDFDKPGGLCIPVGEQEVAEFLGVKQLSPTLFRDPAMQRRVHYLAHAKPAQADLVRARQKRPRAEVAGSSFRDAMGKLNKMLRLEKGLATKACKEFSLEALHEIQHEMFAARSPALQDIYKGDRRSLPYDSTGSLTEAHEERLSRSRVRPDLLHKLRDGLCHELVMMYMHHLTHSAREELRSGSFELPLLPEGDLHAPPAAENVADEHAAAAHADYTAKVSCAICHVVGTASAKEVPQLVADEVVV